MPGRRSLRMSIRSARRGHATRSWSNCSARASARAPARTPCICSPTTASALGFARTTFRARAIATAQTMAIPLHNRMSADDFAYVVDAIKKLA
jgi:dTDP-4-amino-4,6-dideoxygalactose transaminase